MSPTHTPIISSNIDSTKYQNLTDEEQAVLSIVESFAPDTGSTVWGCNHDELMSSAARSILTSEDQIINVITRLQSWKILDCSFTRDDDVLEIWVCPWSSRAMLRHTISDQLIARRNQSTQAA